MLDLRGKRKSRSALLGLLVSAALLAPVTPTTGPAEGAVPQMASPPGQIYVVTVNAYQGQVIGTERFRMMLELVRTLLKRPAAFGGGSDAIGAAPDVILVQEMRESNFEIFEKLLRQRSSFRYEIAGDTSTNGKFLINTDQVAVQGEPRTWMDPCYDGMGEPSRVRNYQWAQLTELETNAPFAVASVHFDKNYQEDTGEASCLERNVEELRRQLSTVTVPTVIGGDFNRRAVESPYECDPNELSDPLPWWRHMTAPEQGTAYVDSIRSWHASRGVPLSDEWTHEQRAQSVACDETTRFKRTRIDYLFTSGMEIANAHADHPGWSGPEPGSRHPINPMYSDHRFLAGRFQIAGPARPAVPAASPAAGGRIQVTWPQADVPIASWRLYRSSGAQPYELIGQFTPEVTSYIDESTEHGRTYRYAIAAVDGAGAQGVESPAASTRADARGPVVTSRSPGRNGIRIDRQAFIVARFNEPIDPASVSRSTVNVYRKGRRLCGTTTLQSARVLVFDPCGPLAKRKTHRVVVYAVRDALGNRGRRAEWSFTTR